MELRTEVEILAPPAEVWRVLTDFPRYHEWNPFISRIDGKLSVGSELTVTMSPPESGESTFRPELLVCEEPRELRWRGRLLGEWFFQGEHFFQCTETEAGHTRFVHGENFKGLLLKFLGQKMTHVARGFVYMNTALKKRVEAK